MLRALLIHGKRGHYVLLMMVLLLRMETTTPFRMTMPLLLLPTALILVMRPFVILPIVRSRQPRPSVSYLQSTWLVTVLVHDCMLARRVN
jgi:hypothetical protein